jgi:hypothetical protein
MAGQLEHCLTLRRLYRLNIWSFLAAEVAVVRMVKQAHTVLVVAEVEVEATGQAH